MIIIKVFGCFRLKIYKFREMVLNVEFFNCISLKLTCFLFENKQRYRGKAISLSNALCFNIVSIQIKRHKGGIVLNVDTHFTVNITQ